MCFNVLIFNRLMVITVLTSQAYNKLWKILKEMGIPEDLTCLLRNLYAGPKATVRTGHGTTDWFKIGKGIRQGHILSWAPKSLQMVTAATKLKDICSLEGKL